MENIKSIKKEKFWYIIEKMNWVSDTDYKRISEEIKSGLYGNEETMKSFLKRYFKYRYNLYEAVDTLSSNQYNKYIGLGDDGLSDLIAHIIGSGKEAYKKVKKNPKDFYDYVDEYRESFYYSLLDI